MFSVDVSDPGHRYYRRRLQLSANDVLWFGSVFYGGVAGALGLRDDGRFYMFRKHLAPLPLNWDDVIKVLSDER